MSDAIELARRAVACKRWRPMVGMRGNGGWTIVSLCGGSLVMVHPSGSRGMRCEDRPGSIGSVVMPSGVFTPDMDDPATLGCVLALVRNAWGPCSTLYCPVGGVIGVWWVVTYEHNAAPGTISRRIGVGPTEAAALVAALEAAP